MLDVAKLAMVKGSHVSVAVDSSDFSNEEGPCVLVRIELLPAASEEGSG